MQPESPLLEVKSFYIKDGISLSVADLSLIPLEFVKEYGVVDPKGTWYYFNRLSVPQKVRNKGYASRLLTEMCEWMDEHRCSVLLEINASGDLSLEDLVLLYEKYGFKLLQLPQCMVREIK